MAAGIDVSLIFGAYAYAVIKESGVQHDIRLAPGRSARVALQEYAIEQRRLAAAAIENAERAERAAAALTTSRGDLTCAAK